MGAQEGSRDGEHRRVVAMGEHRRVVGMGNTGG